MQEIRMFRTSTLNYRSNFIHQFKSSAFSYGINNTLFNNKLVCFNLTQNRLYSNDKDIPRLVKDLNIQGQVYANLGMHKDAINSYKDAINLLKQKYFKKSQTERNILSGEEENENKNNENAETTTHDFFSRVETLKEELKSVSPQESKYAVGQAEKEAYYDTKSENLQKENNLDAYHSKIISKLSNASNNNERVVHSINEFENEEHNENELDEDDLNELSGENEQEDDFDEESFAVKEITFEEVLAAETLVDEETKSILSRTSFSDPNFAVLFWLIITLVHFHDHDIILMNNNCSW